MWPAAASLCLAKCTMHLNKDSNLLLRGKDWNRSQSSYPSVIAHDPNQNLNHDNACYFRNTHTHTHTYKTETPMPRCHTPCMDLLGADGLKWVPQAGYWLRVLWFLEVKMKKMKYFFLRRWVVTMQANEKTMCCIAEVFLLRKICIHHLLCCVLVY